MEFLKNLFSSEKKPDPVEVARLESEHQALEGEMGAFLKDMNARELKTNKE
jgi:hypothetical protein